MVAATPLGRRVGGAYRVREGPGGPGVPCGNAQDGEGPGGTGVHEHVLRPPARARGGERRGLADLAPRVAIASLARDGPSPGRAEPVRRRARALPRPGAGDALRRAPHFRWAAIGRAARAQPCRPIGSAERQGAGRGHSPDTARGPARLPPGRRRHVTAPPPSARPARPPAALPRPGAAPGRRGTAGPAPWPSGAASACPARPERSTPRCP